MVAGLWRGGVNRSVASDESRPGHSDGGIAGRLRQESFNRGLPRASTRRTRRLNDILIRGYVRSIEDGSTRSASRSIPDRASRLRVAIEGYQVTAQGFRSSTALRELSENVLRKAPKRADVAARISLGFRGASRSGWRRELPS
jgi:hypothetical protein